MPTYDYACRDCGHRFDAVQSIHDDALTVCPECGGSLRRVVGAVGVQFKGSGFYLTDNRGKTGAAKKSAAGASSDGSGDGAATGAGTADSDSSSTATPTKSKESTGASSAPAKSGTKDAS
jgi:putative FmdB family regulatory protein